MLNQLAISSTYLGLKFIWSMINVDFKSTKLFAGGTRFTILPIEYFASRYLQFVSVGVQAIPVVEQDWCKCDVWLLSQIWICFFTMSPLTGIHFWNDLDEPPPPNQMSRLLNNVLWLSVWSLEKYFIVWWSHTHYDTIIILAWSLRVSVGGIIRDLLQNDSKVVNEFVFWVVL